MESIVDATTSFVANISSQPYFDARMLVVAPAGIAVSITTTPVTRAGTPSSVQIPNRAAGIMISRRKLYLSTSKLNNDMISASASIIPITIIEKAVLQFPMVVIVFVMTSGGVHCDIIRASPAKQAIMHG